MNINDSAFKDFIIHYYSKVDENDDIRNGAALARVNKYSHKEYETAAIWRRLSEIYIGQNDHKTPEQLKTQVLIDLNYLRKNKSYPIPKNLGISQLTFVHSIARFYEISVFGFFKNKLEKNNRSTEFAFTFEDRAVGPTDVHLWNLNNLKLDDDEKQSLMNEPDKACEKDELDQDKYPRLKETYNAITLGALKIDNWIKENKMNFNKINAFKGASTVFSFFNLFDCSCLEKIELEGVKYVSKNNFTKLSSLTALSCSLDYSDEISSESSTAFIENISQLTKLTSLSLEQKGYKQNAIVTLFPESICKLKKLTSLELSYGNFASFSNKITQLKNLKQFTLKGCSEDANPKIEEFPKELLKLKNLTSINLYNNNISSIPEGIKNLKNLKNLMLVSNKISELSDSIYKHPSLKSINLLGNPIKNSDLPAGLPSSMKIIIKDKSRVEKEKKQIESKAAREKKELEKQQFQQQWDLREKARHTNQQRQQYLQWQQQQALYDNYYMMQYQYAMMNQPVVNNHPRPEQEEPQEKKRRL